MDAYHVCVIRTGLCSVSFRRLAAGRVVDLVADTGLATVEWGADVHAPPADLDAVVGLRERCAARGVAVASLGSYFRAGPGDEFGPVLEAAVALGAPRVRVWAGVKGSADADADDVREVVERTRAAARMARERGVEVAFEFHHGTLTDSPASTLRLLDAVDEPNVSTYWQPPLDVPDGEAVAGLEALLPRVSGLHVFSWWPGKERLPLSARAALWREVFAVTGGKDVDALLEFVPDDDPAVLAREAATLAELVA
ncbi:sugar phosphate isomerase/epimerase family protein [Actinokineospora soli]|uniref:Sugar phosphate isomerase/epimerase family protein n=1 Tax=Actinokineospora soli TaxID=1048753 RepID=A0ABW2TL81_9PSEU